MDHVIAKAESAVAAGGDQAVVAKRVLGFLMADRDRMIGELAELTQTPD